MQINSIPSLQGLKVYWKHELSVSHSCIPSFTNITKEKWSYWKSIIFSYG